MDATATPAKRATAATAAATPVPVAPGFEGDRKAAELQKRIDRLESTVAEVDLNANGAFDRITSLAKLTLNYMKSPDNLRHIGVIADALEQIWWTAEQAQLNQASEVQDVGIEPNNDKRNLEYLRAWAAA